MTEREREILLMQEDDRARQNERDTEIPLGPGNNMKTRPRYDYPTEAPPERRRYR